LELCKLANLSRLYTFLGLRIFGRHRKTRKLGIRLKNKGFETSPRFTILY
jgi:hypothetical protein